MWKPYRSRHLWLFQVYRFFASLHGSFKENGVSDHPVDPSLHGRHLLNTNNSSPSLDGGGVVPTCIPPSLAEFPDDFFTQEQRERGGLIVHALIVAYACAMLAIVCEKYFVPCLKVISRYFKVPSDIAGATFMAVGTSSPELFSSLIGVFVTEGDIGVGTIVGSAVFNILAVTGASGIAVGTAVVQLDWYPITRDCSIYMITIGVLVFIIHDNVVTWVEALVLILMFIGYLTLLYFNFYVKRVTLNTTDRIQNWWTNRRSRSYIPFPKTLLDESSPLMLSGQFQPNKYHSQSDSACPSSTTSSIMASDEMSSSDDTMSKKSGQLIFATLEPDVTRLISEKYVIVPDLDDGVDAGHAESTDEFEESEEVNLWRMPESVLQKIVHIVMWIPNFLFFITIPKCDLPGRSKFFPLTFMTSIAWLGVLSYLCFWMVAVIGYTVGIPDTVSGLTILAAGTSVPELVSSVIVVRSGLGNMALCNLIGSNIFDILFCLGVPWLIKSLLNTESRSLVINSSALTYTTLILLGAVVLFYLTLAICRWRLNYKYGIIAFIIYATFLVVASLYESNFFGDFNPPTCTS